MEQQPKRPGARRGAAPVDELDELGLADLMQLADHAELAGRAQMSADELRTGIRAQRKTKPQEPEEGVKYQGALSVPQPSAEPAPAPVALKSAGPQQYVLEKSMRYVHGGTVYTIAAGSVVSERTHNMADIRRQGAVLAPVGDVETGRDQLGKSVTLIDGKPATDYKEPDKEVVEVFVDRGRR